MSEHMLHIVAPSRQENVGAVVGDLAALQALRKAIEDAIASGTGGTVLAQSDGEHYFLPVVRVADMAEVFTAYAFEAWPIRSARETIPVRAVRGMNEAILKSVKPALMLADGGTQTPQKKYSDDTQSSEA